jgi:hypothetical protein
MTAYYNENEKYAAQWLRNLIAAGHLPVGDVDERSIVEVSADDLRGYTQLHFFAGIGGWPYALRLAGWEDDRPVVTGSCPCQPFSVAGQAKGDVDERHLWPAFCRLIAELRPTVCFGEQVASKLGREWLSGVRVDMEQLGYAFGGGPICRLRASARRISVNDYSGWPTPSASEPGGTPEMARTRKLRAIANGSRMGATAATHLAHAVQYTDWPTPRQEDGESSGMRWSRGKADTLTAVSSLTAPWPTPTSTYGGPRSEDGKRGVSLLEAAAGWATPAQRDYRHPNAKTYAERGGGSKGEQLPNQVQHLIPEVAAWPTPQPDSFRSRSGDRKDEMGLDQLARSIPLEASGTEPSGLPAQTGKRGVLSPAFSLWFAGLPTAVDGFGPVSRVGALRGAGNAIVPQIAAIFIRSAMQIIFPSEKK